MKTITVFICTDAELAKEITHKYLSKEKMPYVSMWDDKTYDQVVSKVEEIDQIGTKECDWCEGLGERTVSVETDNGGGEIVKEECEVCRGAGRVADNK